MMTIQIQRSIRNRAGRAKTVVISIASIIGVVILMCTVVLVKNCFYTDDDRELQKKLADKPSVVKLTKTSLHIGDILAKDSNLTELDLSGCKNFRDPDLQPLTGLRLNSLNLSGTGVTEGGMRIVGVMKSLKTLSLSDTKIGTNGLSFLVPLDNLVDLDISGTTVSAGGFETIHKLSNLKTLVAKNLTNLFRGVKDQEYISTSLENLDVTNDALQDSEVEVISNVRTLKKLTLDDNPVIHKDGLMKLSDLPNLQELSLNKCRISKTEISEFFNDSKSKPIILPNDNKRIAGLFEAQAATVDARGSMITDEALANAASDKKLDVVVLSACHAITDKGVANFKNANCFLFNCDQTQVTDASVPIFSSMKNLKCLSFADCKSITSLKELKPLPELLLLNLLLSRVDADSVPAVLAVLQQPKVETLYLNGCKPSFTQPLIAQLYKTRVKDLSLSTCQLTDDDMEVLSKSTTIQKLDVTCNNITSEGLLSLVKIPSLVQLKLYGNRKLDKRWYSEICRRYAGKIDITSQPPAVEK